MLVVSNDSKYLFNVNGTRLNVYSVASGEIVYRLSYTDESTNSQLDSKLNDELLIKSICINPINKYQLFSFHSNGIICLWDYEDGLLLKTYESKLIIKKAIKQQDSIYVLGELKKSDKKSSKNSQKKDSLNNGDMIQNGLNEGETEKNLSLYKLVIENSIKNQNIIDHQLILSNLSINQDKFQIAIDSNEKYVAYIEGRKKLVINQFKPNNVMKKFNAKVEITCLAIHPNEDCVATGAINGKIIVWYNYLASMASNLNQQEEDDRTKKNKQIKPTMSILHWHALPVISLSFTTEGSFLLSGGHECVLVKWLFKTGQKDFRPRLGAPINEVASSVDNTLYATKHLDNSIHLLGSNFKILQTYSGFLCPNFSTTNSEIINAPEHTFYPTGLNYFKPLNCLVTNGRPGHLQFYSYNKDKLLFNLDIVNENYISPENLNRPNVHTEIECLAFNYDSTWLVTVERRDDLITTPETKLKFWHFDQTNNKFLLNTLVRYPHSFEKINKIKFKPNENILFTCGQDGCFKSWILNKNKPTSSSDSNETTFNWVYNTCNGYRDLVPTDVEFLNINNKDLLAISFNHIITIWNCEYNGSILFVDDLIHCDQSDPIKKLRLIDKFNLLVVHKNCLNIWNLKYESSNDTDLVSSVGDKLNSSCIWNHQIEDVLSVESNPARSSQLLIFLREINKKANIDSQNKLKVATLELENSLPNLKQALEFNLYSSGFIHFICVLKDSQPIQNKEKNSNELNLNEIDIFYTDNRGVIKKLKNSLNNQNDTNLAKSNGAIKNDIDTELTESMWQNRKLLAKNLPESNLAKIIDLNKSNKLINKNKDQFIDETRNENLESNLKKIESTPAYLMPKVGAFCLDTLKSMLFKLDENKYEMLNAS